MVTHISIEQIDNLLPQTQCGECGYGGCKPYAEAMLNNEVDINKCRPGGERVVNDLSKLLDKPMISPAKLQEVPMTAVIDVNACIGCTMCIKACPTECIVGAPKQLHVVNDIDCTGCRLCLDPCPVDCIKIIPNPEFENVAKMETTTKWQWESNRAKTVRYLFENKQERSESRRVNRVHKRNVEVKEKSQTAFLETKQDVTTKISGKLTAEQIAKIQAARSKQRLKYVKK